MMFNSRKNIKKFKLFLISFFCTFRHDFLHNESNHLITYTRNENVISSQLLLPCFENNSWTESEVPPMIHHPTNLHMMEPIMNTRRQYQLNVAEN